MFFLRSLFVVGLVWFPFLGIAQEFDRLAREVAENYANIVLASYEDSLLGARKLQEEVRRFTAEPNALTLQEAKEAWIVSRRPYLQTEVYRFYGGPIDGDDGVEVYINSWPMDESYIDYVEGIPNSGIINDPKAFPEISANLLESANERGGETTISCGYHAIEFLLWGQDFRDDGPGNRAVTDYTTAKHADRRAQYINVCCDLLVRHLEILVREWERDRPDNYRFRFLADPTKAVWNMLSGMKYFSGTELAGERLLVAWDTQAQEDEHSCFSDTTTQDVIYDTQGLINVYLGSYRRTNHEVVSGPGLKVIADQIAPLAAKKLDHLVPDGLVKAKAIEHPFDLAILGDRENEPSRMAILKCVETLEDQSAEWGKVEQRLMNVMRGE